MYLPRFPFDSVTRVLLVSPLPEWHFFSKHLSSEVTYRWLNLSIKKITNSTYLLGPFFGSPQLAFTLEILTLYGLKEAIFIGWGGKTPRSPISTGSLLLPSRAISKTGSTWFYYKNKKVFTINQKVKRQIKDKLDKFSISYCDGVILTVDSPIRVEREPERYNYYLGRAQAVDMETATLYALSNHYGLRSCALIMITDEVGHFSERRPEIHLGNLRESLLPLLKSFAEEGFSP